MKKCKSGWEKQKLKKEETKHLEKVLAATKKITEFCQPQQIITKADSDDKVGTGSIRSNVHEDQEMDDSSINRNDEQEVIEDIVEEVRVEIDSEFPDDVGMWKVTHDFRDFVCLKGIRSYQNIESDFSASEIVLPGETFTRRCSKSLFFRDQLNGERIQRDWICYSPKTGKLFCGICKLFAKKDETSLLATIGYSNWKNAARDLSRHEVSALHKSCIEKLLFIKTTGKRVDRSLVEQYVSEKNYWREFLKRILSVIKLLSSRGLALRGNDEIVGSVNNGNYLGCLELLAEYDPFLAEHLQQRANKGRGHISYLSSTICDEFVLIIHHELMKQIIQEIKDAKYYSVSVDSTPDVSHSDQLTLIIRYVIVSGPVERFIKFVPIYEHTGESLAKVLLTFLEENGSISNCRGQSYDNASNMSGKYKGMQALIRKINNLAEYIPCCGHSLNLVGQSAVDSCPVAVSFFHFVQSLFTFFSASTHRWSLLMSGLTPLRIPTLKRLSGTRWSAHHDAVDALRKGYKIVQQILVDMSESTTEKADTRLEAKGLIEIMNKLETGLMTQVWSTILERFNKTSKYLQNSKLDVSAATKMLKSLTTFIQQLRSQFTEVEEQCKIIYQNETYVEEHKRQIKRNRKWDFHDADAEDADAGLSPSNKFKIRTFLPIIDKLLSSLNQRISAYCLIDDRFGFLSHVKILTSYDLRDKAAHLVEIYHEDLEPQFSDEIVQFVGLFKQFSNESEFNVENSLHESEELQMFLFINKHELVATFPNVSIALRMYLCLMVSNCSGERSFSQLKLIKNDLRSTMGQERLNALSLLSIENRLLQQLDLDSVIDKFASKKTRKVNV